jgi:uncharacterized membrane protein YcfT
MNSIPHSDGRGGAGVTRTLTRWVIVAVGAVLFPYCLALGYWNGERRSQTADVALFLAALLAPAVIMLNLRTWWSLVAMYAGAALVASARVLLRTRMRQSR